MSFSSSSSVLLTLLLAATFACSRESPREEAQKKRAPEASMPRSDSTAAPRMAAEKDTFTEEERLALDKGLADARQEAMAEAEAEIATKETEALEAPLLFTRIAGGDGFFCGSSGNGEIRCWGKRHETLAGTYVDVAISGERLCAATLRGEVKCFGQPSPTGLSSIRQVESGGRHFCALDLQGKVSCWDETGQASMKHPGNLRARYLVMGDGFACATDMTERLICWGDNDLFLPTEAPIALDIAAGDQFVCVLMSPGRTAKCWGKAPVLPREGMRGLFAGSSTLCAVPLTGDAICVGAVEAVFRSKIERIVVGSSAVCAQERAGVLHCSGVKGPQLSPPLK